MGYSIVQYISTNHSVVQCSTVQYSIVQYISTNHSVVQCSTVFSCFLHILEIPSVNSHYSIRNHQYVRIVHSMLSEQYSIVRYNTVLYSTGYYCTVQYSTVLYFTVQDTTVLCNIVLYCTVQYCSVQYCTLYQYINCTIQVTRTQI